MDPLYFARTSLMYQEVDKHLPRLEGNLCGSCNLCCTSMASQGVSSLEFDYIEEFLKRSGRKGSLPARFKKYIQEHKAPASSKPRLCPCYRKKERCCSIYAARPLSCRTFGYFIREGSILLIPASCALREYTALYSDETFPRLLPFALPFYSLVYEYDMRPVEQ